MKEKLRAEIKYYIDHFRCQHQKVSLVEEPLHRKILAVTMISALAEGRYPDAPGQPQLRDVDRFVRLVETYIPSWAQGKSVSLCMIHQAIKVGEPGIRRAFASDVSRRYADWEKGRRHRTVGLEQNPTLDEILASAKTKEEKRLAGDMKHSALLYHYRCKLVHEFREPGQATEYVDTDTEPVYRHNPCELVYPANWMLGLVPQIISGLDDYYRSEAINPYDSYKFGSPWRN